MLPLAISMDLALPGDNPKDIVLDYARHPGHEAFFKIQLANYPRPLWLPYTCFDTWNGHILLRSYFATNAYGYPPTLNPFYDCYCCKESISDEDL